MTIMERARDLLQVRPARQAINRQIREMAAQVALAAPEPVDGKAVISFNASTRITGKEPVASLRMRLPRSSYR